MGSASLRVEHVFYLTLLKTGGFRWQILYNHFPMIHTVLAATKVISSRFSRNSEANASEIREYLEEMFPRYYKHIDIFSTIQWCVVKLFPSSWFNECFRIMMKILKKCFFIMYIRNSHVSWSVAYKGLHVRGIKNELSEADYR